MDPWGAVIVVLIAVRDSDLALATFSAAGAHSPLVLRDWLRDTVDELRTIKANLQSSPRRCHRMARTRSKRNAARYGGLHHAVFRVGGSRRQRGHVYIDIDSGGSTPTRTQACMGEGTDLVLHESAGLRPAQPYAQPSR